MRPQLSGDRRPRQRANSGRHRRGTPVRKPRSRRSYQDRLSRLVMSAWASKSIATRRGSLSGMAKITTSDGPAIRRSQRGRTPDAWLRRHRRPPARLSGRLRRSLGPIRQRRHRLGSADPIDFSNTAATGGGQNQRIQHSIRRGTHIAIRAPPRHGPRSHSSVPRTDTPLCLPAHKARPSPRPPRMPSVRPTASVVCRSTGNCMRWKASMRVAARSSAAISAGAYPGHSGIDLVGRNAQPIRRQRQSIEARRVPQQRSVTLNAHIGDDRRHRLIHAFGGRARLAQQSGELKLEASVSGARQIVAGPEPPPPAVGGD